jgi:hypothetical protein
MGSVGSLHALPVRAGSDEGEMAALQWEGRVILGSENK